MIFAPYFYPGFRAGGPLRSLVAIVATVERDTEIIVVTSDRDLGEDKAYPIASATPVPYGRHQVLYINTTKFRDTIKWLRLARQYRPDVIYINSLWNLGLAIIPAISIVMRLVRPKLVAVAPRGQLYPPALRISPIRKRLAMAFWRTTARLSPISWHATNQTEAASIRSKLGERGRLHLSLNPVNLPRHASKSRPRPSDHIRILYVGRISPIKNLDTLLQGAIQAGPPATLTLAGPIDDAEYYRQLTRTATALGDRFSSIGPIDHDKILNLYAKHDVLFFPSLSENFGHVIAEALSMECPVVCGAVTPFTETIQSGGGEILDHTSQAQWCDAILRWTRLSTKELYERRTLAGKAYAAWQSQRDNSNILDKLVRDLAHA